MLFVFVFTEQKPNGCKPNGTNRVQAKRNQTGASQDSDGSKPLAPVGTRWPDLDGCLVFRWHPLDRVPTIVSIVASHSEQQKTNKTTITKQKQNQLFLRVVCEQWRVCWHSVQAVASFVLHPSRCRPWRCWQSANTSGSWSSHALTVA